MRDAADQAQGVIDALTKAAISNAQNRLGPKLQPTGVCHHCEEYVGELQLFCDNLCASAYEKEKARRVYR